MPSFSGHGEGGPSLARSLTIIWSLCFEEQFYLTLVILFLLSAKNYWKGLLSLGLISIVWRIWAALTDPSINYQDIHMMTHYRWDAIAWGCVAWIKRNEVGTWLAKTWLRRSTVWTLAGASIAFFRFWHPITPLQAALAFTFTAPIFTSILLVLLYSANSPIYRVLEWRPNVQLGQMSYELYLTHLFVIALVARGNEFHDLWSPFTLSVFCLLIAWIFHRFFGKPSRLWILAYAKKPLKRDPLQIV
jgi:peptidoglycan/LPS O-acetylase OafA/YrhL